MSARFRFLDPDFRREPKTDFFCCRCQKDLPRTHDLFVYLEHDYAHILHPDDAPSYQHAGKHPIGPECAKKVGAEWTTRRDK